ncbi:hypothetical protein D3C71_2167810 [compost metagenome]
MLVQPHGIFQWLDDREPVGFGISGLDKYFAGRLRVYFQYVDVAVFIDGKIKG